MQQNILGLRVLALLIDYSILAILALIFMTLGHAFLHDPGSLLVVIIVLNLLFFAKDITGQSPGKRIMKLRIVEKENMNQRPRPAVLFIRNIFLMLGIIELFVALGSKTGERLGDKATYSVVIKIPEKTKTQEALTTR